MAWLSCLGVGLFIENWLVYEHLCTGKGIVPVCSCQPILGLFIEYCVNTFSFDHQLILKFVDKNASGTILFSCTEILRVGGRRSCDDSACEDVKISQYCSCTYCVDHWFPTTAPVTTSAPQAVLKCSPKNLKSITCHAI